MPGQATNSFFTDTIFYDTNGNGDYDEGEGVDRVQVSLRVNGRAYTISDRSTSSGSFAIPLDAVPNGASVEVLLLNESTTDRRISIPINFRKICSFAVPSGESAVLGAFTQLTPGVSFGFRNLLHPPASIGNLKIVRGPSLDEVRVVWPADSLAFALETSSSLDSGGKWNPITLPPTLTGREFNLPMRTDLLGFFRLKPSD